jgi:hypothetical protein
MCHSLRLSEDDVAKVCKTAVVHMSFQPRADTLVLGAADKTGHVSFWHVDREADDPTDGVHRDYA